MQSCEEFGELARVSPRPGTGGELGAIVGTMIPINQSIDQETVSSLRDRRGFSRSCSQ